MGYKTVNLDEFSEHMVKKVALFCRILRTRKKKVEKLAILYTKLVEKMANIYTTVYKVAKTPILYTAV